MATFIYKNGYAPESSRNVEDYEVSGQQILEVWTNTIAFETHRDRRAYFASAHGEHCLSVEFDEDETGKWVLFFYDDQPTSFAPVKTVPSEEDLQSMLLTYG